MAKVARLALLFGYGQSADGELLPQLRARCEVAVAAYLRGDISKIYITCHVMTNNVMIHNKMQDYLYLRGVPIKDILTFAKGTNTAGEIDAFMMLFVRKSSDEIFAISNNYHLPRIKYLFWTRGVNAKTLGTSEHTSWKDLRIEPLKMMNSLIRPFSSSKKIT